MMKKIKELVRLFYVKGFYFVLENKSRKVHFNH
ncbi:hypothetical protein CLV50_2734 [Flavobacterium lindanitolerans]|uniref:Uncharacterized protein n=1 Tax=Flavobacterium lindanitolerans TaxID=428988 RepID=A0A497U2J6_9FLAO|nr:hypothetical protein B0G92_2724 [Flavobacterium lindanitolerans]RLJ24017.1 hypothetical protein CLV50_2734 [Flavobacterium lindanitolerans]